MPTLSREDCVFNLDILHLEEVMERAESKVRASSGKKRKTALSCGKGHICGSRRHGIGYFAAKRLSSDEKAVYRAKTIAASELLAAATAWQVEGTRQALTSQLQDLEQRSREAQENSWTEQVNFEPTLEKASENGVIPTDPPGFGKETANQVLKATGDNPLRYVAIVEREVLPGIIAAKLPTVNVDQDPNNDHNPGEEEGGRTNGQGLGVPAAAGR